MIEAIKSLHLAILLCCCVNVVAAQKEDDGKVGTNISVKIAAVERKIVAGEPLRLRVQIRNEGTEAVFVAANLKDSDNALTRFDLRLYYDGEHIDGPFGKTAKDYLRYRADDPKRPPLANELPKYWLVLPPGNFYGGELEFDSEWFHRLSIPGKYRLQGTYTAAGFLTEGPNNPLASYFQELGHLPYRPWTGSVDTNSIWIEVVHPTH
jgi:hypothetical protein